MFYRCTIESNNSYPRSYDVMTTSAMKCAIACGRCEDGETITVERAKTGVVLSRVKWDANSKKYIRVTV